MMYIPRVAHINAPICPICETKLDLSIDVSHVYSFIWCCSSCDFKAEQATGAITTVVTRSKDLLNYNVRVL